MAKRKKGAGYLYRPTQRDGKPSETWMCQYYDANGRRVRESTRTDNETEARKFLNSKLGKVALGQPTLPRVDRIRYEEAVQDLREHYKTTGSRNLVEAGWRLTHLGGFFTHRRIASIGPDDITKYAKLRQEEKASNGTINREIAVLNRMLKLAYENSKLQRMPILRKFKEAAPRSGFFETEQFQAVRKLLRPDLQVAATLAYTFGWRMQSEVLTLERRQLDLEAETLRLDPGTTKNDEGRIVYLTPELKTLLGAQVGRVDTLQRETKRIIPCLFPHLTGRHQG